MSDDDVVSFVGGAGTLIADEKTFRRLGLSQVSRDPWMKDSQMGSAVVGRVNLPCVDRRMRVYVLTFRCAGVPEQLSPASAIMSGSIKVEGDQARFLQFFLKFERGA
jgi:hypothetical protein